MIHFAWVVRLICQRYFLDAATKPQGRGGEELSREICFYGPNTQVDIILALPAWMSLKHCIMKFAVPEHWITWRWKQNIGKYASTGLKMWSIFFLHSLKLAHLFGQWDRKHGPIPWVAPLAEMLDCWEGILVLSSVSVDLQSTSRDYLVSSFLVFMQVPILQNKFQLPDFQLSHPRYVVCREEVSPLFHSHIARSVLPTAQGEPAVV